MQNECDTLSTDGDGGQCYICLEKTEEISPCKCQIPLHKECLNNMTSKMSVTSCTICKGTLKGVSIEKEETDEEMMNVKVEIFLTFVLVIYLCFMYIFLGWCGKIILLIIGYEIPHFFVFWTTEHLTAAGLMCFLTFVVYHFAGCKRRLRMEASTNTANVAVDDLPL